MSGVNPAPQPSKGQSTLVVLEPDAYSMAVLAALTVFGIQLVTPEGSGVSILYAVAMAAVLRWRPSLPRFATVCLMGALLVLSNVLKPPIGFVQAPATEILLPLLLLVGIAWAWPLSQRITLETPTDAEPIVLGRAGSSVAAEEMFRRIYEASQVGMALVGRNQRLVGLNPILLRLLGYSEGDLRGQPLVSIAHPETGAALERWMQELLSGSVTNFKRDLRCVRKDCKIIWVSLSASVVRDEEDQVLFGLVMIDDVTQRRQVEERLRQRESEYAHASRLATVGEMATGLAHEINQPLAAITNYADASMFRIKRGEGDSDDQLQDLENIAHQAERASEIIRRLRGFLRKRESHRGDANINDIVNEVIEFTQFELRSRQVQVETDLDDVPQLVVDRVQIQQVLVNLIRNGVEAMNQTPIGQRRLILSTRRGRNAVAVSVVDHGRGLPPGVSQRLFRPFFSTKPDGLGVGLSISRTIVESHHGRLWAESNGAQGTAFYFTLPARPVVGEAPDSASAENAIESQLGPE